MTIRIALLILCLFSLSALGQKNKAETAGTVPAATKTPPKDLLLESLGEAERYQAKGDLPNALIANKKVLGIALQRRANISIEEGKYDDAVRSFTESLKFEDSASNRTNLAVAYLRQNLLDKALYEAQMAVALDPDHFGGHYILGNIYYTKEDYRAALPELELVFAKTPDFEIARALGLSYLNLKQIDKARAHFKKMTATAGKPNADLHILFAKFYERTNYPDDAERELIKALKIEPNKPKINFYIGYLLLQNGGSSRLAEAGKFFGNELKINPRDFYSQFFSGVVASSQNDHKRAIPFLQKAVEINPNSGEGFLFLGQSQIEIKDLVNAEKNLRRAVALEANGGKNTQARRTHFMLGRLLLKSGRKEEAKKELAIAAKLQQKSLNSSRNEIDRILSQVAENSDIKKVDEKKVGSVDIKLAPERVEQLKKVKLFLIGTITQAYYNLGVIAAQNGQLDSAVDNFSAGFRWQPEYPNLSRNLGIVSFRANAFDRSIEPLTHHLKKNPNDVLVRKMLGSSYYLTGDFKNSVETLKVFDKSITADAELAYFYGTSLIRLKRNREAVTVFEQLAKLSQSKSESLFYAAQGFMMAGEFSRAIKEFGRVLTLAPKTQKANYFIGQSYIRLNRPDEAEKAFSKELIVSPGDALSMYHLALTLIERKIQTQRAIAILNEAATLRYNYADAHYQLGKIYLEKGELTKAIEQLERAASADAKKDYIYYQLSIAYRKAERKDDASRALKTYQRLKKEQRKTDNPMPMGGNETEIPETR